MLVQVEQLKLGWERNRLFNQEPWDFSIPKGSVTAVIGPNGSGKTLLLKGLLGEALFGSGRVILKLEEGNIEVSQKTRSKGRFSYLPQEQPYAPSQLVNEFLRIAFLPELGFWGKPSEAHEANLRFQIDRLGINKAIQKKMSDLSTGERQRVFLARALSQKSVLTLLDEPTNHLDPEGTAQVWQTLFNLKGNHTIVVTTHDLAQVEKNCDWIIGVYQGRIVFQGPIEDYFRKSVVKKLFPNY